MATTITAASMTVTITEAVTIGGADQGGTVSQTITNITETDRRIFTCTTTEADIIGFGTDNGQGQHARTTVKYGRVTNLDDTNFVTLGVSESSGDTFYIKLEAGQSFLFGNDDLEVDAAGGASSAFSEADAISAKSDTAAVDLEIFVATT